MVRIRMISLASVVARVSFTTVVTTVFASAVAITPTLSAQGGMPSPPASARAMSGHASADSAQSLVNFLTTVNRDEVALARLALSRAVNPDIRAYAERALADHGNTLSAWELKVPSLSLTIPDSVRPARSASATLRSTAMTNGISEVRDTVTIVRGGVGSAAIHSANIALLAQLEKLSGAEFEAMYVTSEIEGHDVVLKELEKHPTTYTELQTLLTEFKSMTLDHRAAARKLKAGN